MIQECDPKFCGKDEGAAAGSKSVNIEGLGVFMLTARSKGAELAKDINAKSVESVRIFFQANKELRKGLFSFLSGIKAASLHC